MGLRPPVALPTQDIRAFSKWCREAIGDDIVEDADLSAAIAALTAAYIAADAAHVAASDPHPTYTTAAELAAGTAAAITALLAAANAWALTQTFTLAPIFPSYVVASLPSVTPAARMIYVTNETGGAVMAFSDGTNWRRVTDRNVVS